MFEMPEREPHDRTPFRSRLTFRRFLVVWTLLAVVAWILFASQDGHDGPCRETDFICFEQREIDLIAAVVVGIPWIFGLGVVGLIVGLVRWHRYLSDPS